MASLLAKDGNQKSTTDANEVVHEIITQLVISIALGLSAFLGFCVCIMLKAYYLL